MNSFQEELAGWLEGVGSKKKYAIEYEDIQSWTLGSFDEVKFEIAPLLFPIYVLSFISLVSQGYMDEAIIFRNKFQQMHVDHYHSEMQHLLMLTHKDQLDKDEFLHQHPFM